MQNNKKNDMIKDSVFDNFIKFNKSKKKDPKPRLTVIENYHIKKLSEKIEEGLRFYTAKVVESINKNESWENIDIGLYLNNRIRPILESVWSNGWDEGSNDVLSVINKNAIFNRVNNIVNFTNKNTEDPINKQDEIVPPDTTQFPDVKKEYAEYYLKYRFENIQNQLSIDAKKQISSSISEYIGNIKLNRQQLHDYKLYVKPEDLPREYVDTTKSKKNITVGNLWENIAQILIKDTNTTGNKISNRATRIISTELTAAYNIGSLQDMLRRGIEYVMWRPDAEHFANNKFCKMCAERLFISGKDYLPKGVFEITQCLKDPNLMIPLHPHCKCYLEPVILDNIKGGYKLETQPVSLIDKLSVLVPDLLGDAILTAPVLSKVIEEESKKNDVQVENNVAPNWAKAGAFIVTGAAMYGMLITLLVKPQNIITKTGAKTINYLTKQNPNITTPNITTPNITTPKLLDVDEILKDEQIQSYINKDDIGIPINIPLVIPDKEGHLITLNNKSYEVVDNIELQSLNAERVKKNESIIEPIHTFKPDKITPDLKQSINVQNQELLDELPNILEVSYLQSKYIPSDYMSRLSELNDKYDNIIYKNQTELSKLKSDLKKAKIQANNKELDVNVESDLSAYIRRQDELTREYEQLTSLNIRKKESYNNFVIKYNQLNNRIKESNISSSDLAILNQQIRELRGLINDYKLELSDIKASIDRNRTRYNNIQVKIDEITPTIDSSENDYESIKYKINELTKQFKLQINTIENEIFGIIRTKYSNVTIQYYKRELALALERKNTERFEELIVEIGKLIGYENDLANSGLLTTLYNRVSKKVENIQNEFLLGVHRNLQVNSEDYRLGRIPNIFNETGEIQNYKLADQYLKLYNLHGSNSYIDYFKSEIQNIDEISAQLKSLVERNYENLRISKPQLIVGRIRNLHNELSNLEPIIRDFELNSQSGLTEIKDNVGSILETLKQNAESGQAYRSNVYADIDKALANLKKLKTYISNSEFLKLINVNDINRSGTIYDDYLSILPYLKYLQNLKSKNLLNVEYLRSLNISESNAQLIINNYPNAEYILGLLDSNISVRNTVRKEILDLETRLDMFVFNAKRKSRKDFMLITRASSQYNIGYIEGLTFKSYKSRMDELLRFFKNGNSNILIQLKRNNRTRTQSDILSFLAYHNNDLKLSILQIIPDFQSKTILTRQEINSILRNDNVITQLQSIDRANTVTIINNYITDNVNFEMEDNVIKLIKTYNIASFNNKLEYYKNNSLKEFVRSKLKTRFKFY